MTDRDKLDAIIARINGEFDNPALLKFGPLSTDTLADVTEIARPDSEARADARGWASVTDW